MIVRRMGAPVDLLRDNYLAIEAKMLYYPGIEVPSAAIDISPTSLPQALTASFDYSFTRQIAQIYTDPSSLSPEINCNTIVL